MDSPPHRIVIIGTGPTAMGAALRLQQLIDDESLHVQVTMLEESNRVGGLASSVTTTRGFTYDLGVHVTGQSKYEDFLRVIDNAVGEWNYLPRCVKASMRHVFPSTENPLDAYVPYPVQDSITFFPEELRRCCEKELEEIASKNGERRSCRNFGEFALETFGETLTRLFIRPYNEKVWTVRLEEMDCCWVEGRVPRPAVRNVLERNNKTNVVFRYPAQYRGMGEVWRRIACSLPPGWIRLSTKVVAIDTVNRKVVVSSDESLPFDTVISTIPLDSLGRISSLLPSLPLKHSKVVLAGIGMYRPQPLHTEELSWMYFPQKDTIFYRVTFISNFNQLLTPNAALFWSVLCEIGVEEEEEVDDEEIAEKTVKDLIKEGVIQEDTKIAEKWIHVLPYGYPVPTLHRNEVLKKAQSILESHSIFSRGRFGSWLYEVANQDHSFTMGTQVIDRIFKGQKESVHLM